MPIHWKLFRILCIAQSMLSGLLLIRNLVLFFIHPRLLLLTLVAVYLLCFLLATFGSSLLSANYPDVPVAGVQKSRFNKLFILNFLIIAVLIGAVIADWTSIRKVQAFTLLPLTGLPVVFWLNLLADLAVLLFQLLLLTGLYFLRLELLDNFDKRAFDFEQPRKP